MNSKKNTKINIETSARHVHLSRKDADKLFGKNYQLSLFKQLSQPKEFASNDSVVLKTKKGEIRNVRILGPIRDYTQVEISRTDAFALGVKPPVRESGMLDASEKITIIGPAGQVNLRQGLILAWRHIHASEVQAKQYGLKHGKFVQVRIKGERGLVFDKVMVKVNKDYDWSMHIDTDEANASGVSLENMTGEVLL